MKKILIFSLAYYPKHVGGAEVAIKEITDRLDPKDYEFHMVALRFDDTLSETEQIGNVLVHRIGPTKHDPTMSDLRKFPLYANKFLYQFLAAWKAHKLHQKYHFDGIWAMMAHSCGVPAGLFKTFHPKVKYLLTLQEGDPIPYIKKKMLPIYPLFVRGFTSADMVQAISNYLADWAKNMGFKGPLFVIPNAVSTKHFSQEYSKEEIDHVKKLIGKNEGDLFLITTSRLVKKNAVDDVIRSLPHLPKNIKFAILGIGPDEEMLRLLAASLKVSDRVIFLGQIAHTEMPKYLKACDIFIRPSLSEGMGNSFIEAMAAGLPVIATREGGIADFLFDPELNPNTPPTGRAVHPRDPEGIARAVELFMEKPEETAKIAANAKKMVFAKYDWDIIARDMKEKVFGNLFN
ncbi:MAG: glycosyltransferase [Candidatus Paceibacterota bacterium]|jgi:1,2-diacylglycerol 3-alpha-glucosyltransferase|nr:glycosyltransferase [Candidatus Paceibacterota bacterium]